MPAGDPPPYGYRDYGYMPYNTNPILSAIVTDDTLQKAFTGTLKTVGRELTAFEELKGLVWHHLYDTRGLQVYEADDNDLALVWKDGLQVFSSVSWVACIEWALKQPVLEKKE